MLGRRNRKKAIFITFEGLEGAGKSTQAKLLAGGLRKRGRDVVLTREPGGTRIGERIRGITNDLGSADLTAEAEAYLMAAARAQHVGEVVLPSLAEGKIVVCDRFIDSSLAYQGGGRELGFKEILELNRIALAKGPALPHGKGGLLLPDLTIYLDVEIKTGMARRAGTAKVDRLDLQGKEFYSRVEEGYREVKKKFANRIVGVNGEKGIGEVGKEIWGIVSQKLNLK